LNDGKQKLQSSIWFSYENLKELKESFRRKGIEGAFSCHFKFSQEALIGKA
jgi:hypothetical protein